MNLQVLSQVTLQKQFFWKIISSSAPVFNCADHDKLPLNNNCKAEPRVYYSKLNLTENCKPKLFIDTSASYFTQHHFVVHLYIHACLHMCMHTYMQRDNDSLFSQDSLVFRQKVAVGFNKIQLEVTIILRLLVSRYEAEVLCYCLLLVLSIHSLLPQYMIKV